MARTFSSGGFNYLSSGAGALLTAAPMTMAAWVKPATHNATNDILSISDATVNLHAFVLRQSSTGSIQAVTDASGTLSNSASAGTVSNGTWAHAAAVFASASSRTAYLNGTAATADTTALTPTAGSLGLTLIGAIFGGPQNFYNGDIAEVALWNVALTAADVAVLALGVSPLLVRPDALVSYSVLDGQSASFEIDRMNPARMGISGASSALHPRMFYASTQQPIWMGPRVATQFAADSSLGFSTSSSLKAVARFSADSTFGLSTSTQLSTASRFSADSTFGFSSDTQLTSSRPPAPLIDTAKVTFVVNGVDVTHFVRKLESEISETQNQGAPQASIVVRGLTPVEGQRITITDTVIGATLFDGQIVSVDLVKRRASTRAWYRLECDQWGKLFDRRLVYDVELPLNIDTIVTHLVGSNTSGFTYTNVQSGLTATTFKASGDRMTQCLQRLASLVHAVFRILPTKDVYFRTTTNLAAPVALSTTNKRFKDLHYVRRISDLRTRVYARGASTSVLADVQAWMQSVPLQSIALFTGAALIILDGLRYSVSNFQSGGIGSTLSSSANAGDTTLHLASTINFTYTGWALINGQYVYWNGKTNGSPGTLFNVPPTGTGALISTMPSGASIVTVPSAVVSPSNAALPAGASAQLVVQSDDVPAQAALAALEGGDGIHEFDIENTQADSVGALQALGAAELAVGKNVIESASYISEDENAQVGAVQAIALPGVSTSLPITSVRIHWVPGRGRPQREVTTATVQRTLYQFLADLHDASIFSSR